jgi:hypothetical protein
MTGAYILSLLPWWTRGALLQRMFKGGQPQRQPRPQPGPCPCRKGNHWRSKCPHLQMEGKMPPLMDWWVPAPCPCSTSWQQCWGASWWPLSQKKKKIIFWLDSGAHFSVLSFSPGPRSNDKSYCSGQIWPSSRVLIYLASGLLLGRPPFLSPFPHSS